MFKNRHEIEAKKKKQILSLSGYLANGFLAKEPAEGLLAKGFRLDHPTLYWTALRWTAFAVGKSAACSAVCVSNQENSDGGEQKRAVTVANPPWMGSVGWKNPKTLKVSVVGGS